MTRLLGIGDFARSVGLSVSAVRFYADRGLLSPAHVDASTGYRSFDPAQVADGCLVRDLRLIGIPLAQVGAALALPPADIQQLADRHIDGLEAGAREARSIARRLGESSRTEDTLERAATAIAAADLVGAFEQVLPFSSRSAEHPHLMTVLVAVEDGSMRVVTTDTHRLAVREIVTQDAGDDFRALVSAVVVRRWLTELTLLQTVRLRLDGESLWAVGVDGSLCARTVPATFPDYEVFLTPPEDSSAIVVGRQTLLDALERFDDETGAVMLSSDEHGTRVHRRDSTVTIDAELHGADVDVAIDPALGTECASAAIGAEVVVEVERDPLRPVLFRSATNGTFVSLLMPVNLANYAASSDAGRYRSVERAKPT